MADANAKISELTQLVGASEPTDLLVIVDNSGTPETKHITVGDFNTAHLQLEGAAPASDGEVALFDGTGGTAVRASGVILADIGIWAPAVTTPTAISRWDSSTGASLDDTGVLIDDDNALHIPGDTTHGQYIKITADEEEIELSGGATFVDSASALIPAGSIVLGVTTRVLANIVGSSSFCIGDDSEIGDSHAFFGSAIDGTAAGDTTDLSDHEIAFSPIYGSTAAIRVTASSLFTSGTLLACVHYISLTPPQTS